MASWRDSLSEQAQQDIDQLTDAAMDFALEQLEARGGFLPFALAVSTAGDIQAIQPNTARNADLDAPKMLDSYWRALSRINTSLRAVIVAVDVRLPETDGDGIDLSVEHREGIALSVVFPYTPSGDGTYDVGSPAASSTAARVWAAK